MPTTLTTFAQSEFRMRFKEEFLTDGLNAKLAVVTPPGTYRGFKLATNGSNLTVTVSADVANSDHVAVFQTSSGRSITIRKAGGDFSLSLASFVNKTVVLAIFATEVVGSPTAADIRAYELAPSDTFTGAPEVGELVVLGTVVVPAAGLIPAANITADRRTPAWAAEATDAVAWAPVVSNPSFEHGVTAGTNRHAVTDWVNRTELATNGAFRLGTSNVRSGAKCLEYNKTSTSASVGRFEQLQELPVVPGQIVRVVGWIRQLIAPTGGSYQLNVYWGDLDSTTVTSTTLTASAAGTDASYRKVEATVTVPVSKYVLKTISIEVVNVTSATTGVAVLFDDVQVYVEAGSPLALAATANRRLQQEAVTSLVIEDPGTYSLGQLAALVRFDRTTPSSEGKVVIERKDQNASALPPALEVIGRLLGLGSGLIATEADALKPRVTAPIATAANINFTLLWESKPGSLKAVRIYVGDLDNATVTQPGLLFTVNALFDGTNWIKDVDGEVSSGFYIGASSSTFRLLTQIAATNTWTSGFWVSTGRLSSAGVLALDGESGGYQTTNVQTARLELIEGTDAEVNPVVSLSLGVGRRAPVILMGTGDIVGVSTVDPHGRFMDSGIHLEEDFLGSTLPSTLVKDDLVGTGTIVTSALASNATITTGATSGNFTILRYHQLNLIVSPDGQTAFGFTARVAVDLTNSNTYMGYWAQGVALNPDNDSALTGFRIVNGVVTFVWTDSGGPHTQTTGLTLSAGYYWFSFMYDNAAGGRYSIKADNTDGYAAGAEGYLSGTYDGSVGISDLSNGEDNYPFVGVKTTSAGTSSIQVDYFAAWSNTRNPY